MRHFFSSRELSGVVLSWKKFSESKGSSLVLRRCFVMVAGKSLEKNEVVDVPTGTPPSFPFARECPRRYWPLTPGQVVKNLAHVTRRNRRSSCEDFHGCFWDCRPVSLGSSCANRGESTRHLFPRLHDVPLQSHGPHNLVGERALPTQCLARDPDKFHFVPARRPRSRGRCANAFGVMSCDDGIKSLISSSRISGTSARGGILEACRMRIGTKSRGCNMAFQ